MTTTLRIMAVSAALVLGAAACGDTTPNVDRTTASSDTRGPSGVTDVTIVAEKITFDTTELEARVGETLTITYDNRDARIPHNLHVNGGTGGPAKTAIEEGPVTQSLKVTFEEAGTFEYFCEVHPQQMRGTITVSS